MDLKQTHPLYRAFLDRWQLMADVLEGEDAVKAKGEAYLPMPPGMRDKAEGGVNLPYENYKARAQFYEIVAPTVRGLAGVMHRTPATIELPPALEFMREQATRDGMTLDALHRRITHQVLSFGRYGLLADVNERGEPVIATYAATAIRNWDDIGTLVVLDETGDELNPESLAWTRKEQFRVLRLEDGRYVARLYDPSGNVQDEAEPQGLGGVRLSEVPFVFIDTNDLTPDPDEVPLIGLGRIALALYRKSADYEQALFMTSQPTAVVIGVDDAETVPKEIGAGALWLLPPGGDAKYLEFTGAGISAQRQAMQDDQARAVQLGARMMEDQQRNAESGEALELRYSSQTATLATISQTVASGLEKALRHCAVFAGANPDDVHVVPHTDFLQKRLSAQEILALVSSWQAGAFSKSTLFENLQAGGVIDPDKSFDDEQAEIETEAPTIRG